MNRAQISDTGAEKLQLILRMQYLKHIVDDIEAETRVRAADYRAALRTVNAVKAALGTSGPRRSAQPTRPTSATFRPLVGVITQGDPRFAEAERRWRQQRAAKGIGSKNRFGMTFSGGDE